MKLVIQESLLIQITEKVLSNKIKITIVSLIIIQRNNSKDLDREQ